MPTQNLFEHLRSPVEVRVTVAAAPDAVFKVLSDPETYDGEVVTSNPPKRLVLQIQAGPLKGEAEYELERTVQGTLVTFRERLTGPLQHMMPLVRGPMFLRNRASLDRLRERFAPLVVRL